MAAQVATRVSLVGLGNMGLAVGERLLDSGYALSVYNRTPGRDEQLLARGATRLGSAANALEAADVCVTTLRDDAAVEDVVGAALSRAHPGTSLIEMSTISVAASQHVAARAAVAGVDYLRAPFSGNPSAIRAGTAVIFVSGPPDAVERCDALLHAIAPTVRPVGDGEQARALKLLLQVLIGGTAELLAEAVVLGEAAGLDRRTVLETIGASVVGSTFVGYKSEPLLRDDYAATFTTAMMQKDVGLVLELAAQVGVELPLTDELASVLDATCDGGHAEDDFMSVVLELQERSKTNGKKVRT